MKLAPSELQIRDGLPADEPFLWRILPMGFRRVSGDAAHPTMLLRLLG
jgi:hypothetical protein